MAESFGGSLPGETTGVPVPLHKVLAQMSRELNRQAAQLAAVELAIGRLAERASRVEPRVIRELQHIDAVRQSMQALAGFSSDLSRLSRPAWAVDVAAAARLVELSALAERLWRGDEETGNPPVPPHGDVDLFE